MQDEVPIVNNPTPVISKANLFLQFFSQIPRAFLILGAIAIVVPLVFLYVKNQVTSPSEKAKSEFTLVESSPSDQQNSTPVIAQPTFVFSKKIGVSEGELNKYFNISPKVEGSWHMEKNRQVVYFSTDKKQPNTFPRTFDYRTTYTVTIDKSFHSDGNKTLADNQEVSFKTIPNPEFGTSTYKSLLPLFTGESVDLEVETNQSQDKYVSVRQSQLSQPFDVTIKKATKEELLQYFKYGKDSYLAINHVPETLMQRDGIKTTGQYIYRKNTNNPSAGTIRVLNPIFKTPGIYFISFGNKYGSDNMFAVISNHVNQVVNDENKSYVIVTDAKSNKANSNVKAEYYKAQDNVELLDSQMSDNDGIAASNTLKDNCDFVITTKGDDIAVTQTRTWRMGLNKEEDVKVFSYTDRPVYRPGDTVHYKAIIRLRDENSGKNTIPNKTYYIKYVSGFDVKKGDYKTVTTDENGTVVFDTVLPYTETNAYPQIVLADKNSKGEYVSIDSLQLGVEFYKKPDMDITVTAGEKEYTSKDTSHLTVIGKTNYGQPLSNISFTYRVMLVNFSEVKDRSTEQTDSDVYSYYYGGGEELTSGKATFDQKGTAKIEYSTDMPKKFIQSQVAMIEITPNIGAVPSFGKIAKLIHRGEFTLFLDDVKSDTQKGISGNISALNHKNPRVPVGSMKGKLYLTQKDMYSQSPGKLIEMRDIELDQNGKTSFTFQNVTEGSYEVKTEFVDPRGNTVTATEMTYAGIAKVYQQPLYSMDVSFDQPNYKEGETAKAHITYGFAPDDMYIVTAGIRGSVTNISTFVRKQGDGKTGAFNISIPINRDTATITGIYLYTVKGGQVVQGQAQFTVIRKIPEIKTTILFDHDRYKPGDTVTATLLTKNEEGKGIPADNSLSIIDASLLQLGKLKTGITEQFNPPNPFIALSHFDSTTGIYADGPGGGGGCFLEGTKILMGDGTTKNIEDVKTGDTILTKKNDTSMELVSNEVTNTFKHIVTEYILINNRLKVTPIHRIYLNKKWTVASDAKVGDTLTDENGQDVVITSIAYQEGIFRVYNLTTSPNHTFFADGIYVHNEKGMDARQNFVDTLYWNPHIATDSNGKATVKFKLADNVTTFTGAAYSNTKDSLFGEATASIKSYKDLTLIPSIANLYYENDKPIISVLVQNSTNNDMDMTVTSSVKELPGINSQDVHVKGNDMEVISVPLDLSNIHNSSTFIIEAKDRNGKLLDSVLMKKPLLPQGNIMASWQSYENSFDHKFSVQFPKLDVNRLTVSIVPNAAAKLFQDYLYISYNLSVETGQDLYAYSYILARTRDGFIDPTSYHYAKLKNDFINAIDTLSTSRGDVFWYFPPNNYSKDSLEASNLWVVMGLEQAKSNHMLDEISNVNEIINSTKEYFKNSQGNAGPITGKLPPGMPPPPMPPSFENPSPTVYPTVVPVVSIAPPPPSSGPAILTPAPTGPGPTVYPSVSPTGPIVYAPPMPSIPYAQPLPPAYRTDAEKVIRSLVYGEQFPDDAGGFDRSAQGLALRVLNGDKNSINTLLAQRITSADDRHFWSEFEIGDQAVWPVVALVEKGSDTDAEKAIRGLSFNQSEMSPLAIYAAIKYAQRKNIYVSKPSIKLTVNGDQEFSYPNADQTVNAFPSFSHTYSTASSKDGTVDIKVDSDNKIPVYATITEFSYTGYTNTQKVPPGKGNYKYMDFNFARTYKDTATGETVPEIGLGKTGAVVLSGDLSRIAKGTMVTNIYSFMGEDALSPNYIYLDQSESGYNPQYESVLKKLFSSPSNYVASYTLPSMYSDQAVFFDMNANTRFESINLPYVIYNASGGTYFRPKTSIVLPILGIISTEK